MTAPYQKHSTTSREAAEQLSNANTMENDIITILKNSEYDGATGDEIALNAWMRTEYPTLQSGTVAARLRGLEIKGIIVKTKSIRKTRNNRNAHVWKLPLYAKIEERIAAGSNTSNAQTNDLSEKYINVLMEIKGHCKTRHSSAAIYEIMKTIDKALTVQT